MPAQEILAAAQEERFVIEDFTPLADSIEWDLGQQYLRLRGSKAFISDTSPVPSVINNDGLLSCQAAEVFFSSLVETDKQGAARHKPAGILSNNSPTLYLHPDGNQKASYYDYGILFRDNIGFFVDKNSQIHVVPWNVADGTPDTPAMYVSRATQILEANNQISKIYFISAEVALLIKDSFGQ